MKENKISRKEVDNWSEEEEKSVCQSRIKTVSRKGERKKECERRKGEKQ